MKLYLTISLLFISFFGKSLLAQIIDTNLSFEEWQFNSLFEEPQGFATSNLQTYFDGGEANVQAIEDSFAGDFAARLENNLVDDEVIPGTLIGGQIVDGEPMGIPFSSFPDSLVLQVRYEIMPSDTAGIFLLLSNEGFPVATALQTITGSNTLGYQRLSIPVQFSLPSVVDELLMLISSGDDEMPVEGSWLEVDEIDFVYNGTEGSPFPNGDLDNWNEVGSEEPVDWYTSNAFTLFNGGLSVTKSEDSFEGDYAVRLESKTPIFEGEGAFSFLANGPIGEDGPIPEVEITEIPAAISGFYKYSAITEGDSATCYLMFQDQENENIGELAFLMSPQQEYEAFTFNLPYDDLLESWPEEPVKVFFGFSSTKIEDSTYLATPGSVLFVDQVSFEYPTGINEILIDGEKLSCFPNPTNNRITLQWTGKANFIRCYSSMGKLLREESIAQNMTSLSLDISNFIPGSYIIELETLSGVKRTQVIKQ